MRILSITLALVAVSLLSTGCGKTREIDPAVPQTGPLIGTWEYVGDDLVDQEGGIVRDFVIGDGTWYIPKNLTFKPDGTSANTGYHDCHFWILDDGHVKLSVGNGNRVHTYEIKGETLILTLAGPFNGTSEALTFTRVNP